MQIIIVVVFLIPAGVTVLLGWWVQRSATQLFLLPTWRNRVTSYGLLSATVGFVLELAFMIREFSFSSVPMGSLYPLWMLMGWAAVLTWVICIIAAVVGLGRLRWILLLYVMTSAVGIFLFVNQIMD
jgi:hypothetical protein